MKLPFVQPLRFPLLRQVIPSITHPEYNEKNWEQANGNIL